MLNPNMIIAGLQNEDGLESEEATRINGRIRDNQAGWSSES